jgi:LSD1 subclass zinc finger protein
MFNMGEAMMKSMENCGVCGKPLVYGTAATSCQCAFCGKTFNTMIFCPEGHYVCDACHQKSALEVLRSVLSATKSDCPEEILEKVLSHPAVPMHGPEHHAIVPAVLITAIKNAGYTVPEGAVEKAIQRGSKVPGGWCGQCGVCGAGIGLGIAVSVLTGATPLTGKERSLAIDATARAQAGIVDEGPRCCKRSSRKALEVARKFFKERMGITLKKCKQTRCTYVERNRECIREACPYYNQEQFEQVPGDYS